MNMFTAVAGEGYLIMDGYIEHLSAAYITLFLLWKTNYPYCIV